jgi:hypothetical protein
VMGDVWQAERRCHRLIRPCHRLVPRLPCRLDTASVPGLQSEGDMQKLDFSLFVAIAAGIVSVLTAIYSTAYAFHFIASTN